MLSVIHFAGRITDKKENERCFQSKVVACWVIGSMFKNERLKSLRHQPFEKQSVLTDGSRTQTLERCVLKRVDNLVDWLDILHQLGERVAL